MKLKFLVLVCFILKNQFRVMIMMFAYISLRLKKERYAPKKKYPSSEQIYHDFEGNKAIVRPNFKFQKDPNPDLRMNFRLFLAAV